jgi:phage tail protein X
MAADQVIARQGDTVDGLMWRDRGLQPADLPAVFEANPGLAAKGDVLPAGTVVTVPESAAPAARTLPLIQLWD